MAMADTLNDALAVIRAATLLSGDLQEGRLVVLRRWHRRVWWVDRGGTCPARASTRCSALHRVARSRLFWVAAITSDIRKWRRCAVRKSLSADCVLRSNPPPIPVQRRQCFRFKRAAVSDPLPPPTFHARSARRLRRVARAGGRACGHLVFSAQDACLRRGCRH